MSTLKMPALFHFMEVRFLVPAVILLQQLTGIQDHCSGQNFSDFSTEEQPVMAFPPMMPAIYILPVVRVPIHGMEFLIHSNQRAAPMLFLHDSSRILRS